MSRPASEEARQQWHNRILQQSSSGLSVARWCCEHNITRWHFDYWKRKLFPETLQRSSFKELTEEVPVGLTLEYQGITLRLERNFDPVLLKACLAVLKQC